MHQGQGGVARNASFTPGVDKSGRLDFGGTPPDPELDRVSSTRIGHFTSNTVGGTKTINSRGVIVF
jgi:hypothetical protein